MKRLSIILFVVLICLASTLAAAENMPNAAEYTIPSKVQAAAEADFYGIWEAKYVEFFGTPFLLADLDPSLTFSYEIYKDKALLIASGVSYYCIGREFKNGKLSFTDETGKIELTMHDDGSISFLSDGYPVYCMKQNVEYGEVPYKALARTPENYIGQYASFSGNVMQVLGTRKGDYYQILLNVDGDYSKQMLIEFVNIPDFNILEGDEVKVYIRLAGEYSYTTVLGAVTTVPLAFAQGIDLLGE